MKIETHPDLGTIPEHWNIAEIGDVADVTKLAGYEFTKHIKYIEDGEIIALRSLNVVDGQLDITNIKRIAKSVSDELPRSKLFKNDLLLTYTGSKLGDTALIDANDKYHLAPNVCRLRANEDDDAYFLYLFLRSKTFSKLLDNYKVGSGQPTVPMKNIRKIPLPWPPKDERKKIGDVYSSLNNKVEVNRQINQTLEQIAQAIFKSWFVDFEPVKAKIQAKQNGQDPERAAIRAISGKTDEELDQLSKEHDAQGSASVAGGRTPGATLRQLTTAAALFPDELEDSELGEIPKGWEIANLGIVTSELRRGISPKYTEEGGVQVINQKCIRNHTVDFSLCRRNNPAKRKIEGRELQVGDIVVNSTGVGTLGRLAPVRYLSETTVADSHVTVVRGAGGVVMPSFLAGLMLSKESLIESSGAGSTGQTELRRQVLEEISFCNPPYKLQEAFEKIVQPTHELTAHNELQKFSLAATRDLLLPKLLSGEITLSDTKSNTEAVA